VGRVAGSTGRDLGKRIARPPLQKNNFRFKWRTCFGEL